MGESGHKIDGSVLEWSLWEVSLVIDYLVHMTESGLFSSVNKSRDVALAVQVLPISGPTFEALNLQCKSLDFLQGFNISKKKGVPNNCIIFKMGADEIYVQC